MLAVVALFAAPLLLVVALVLWGFVRELVALARAAELAAVSVAFRLRRGRAFARA